MFAGFNRSPARPKAPRGKQKMQNTQFPAPVRGWVVNESFAAVQPGGAYVLDNWFPTPTGIRLRGGNTRHATISTAVQSLFAYRAGIYKMFAADATKVYDITAPVDPDIAPAPAITGQTSGYYSSIPFTTSGGNFLYILNGTDSPQLFDGATWTAITGVSTPAITNVTSNKLIQGCSYRNRLFFVEKNSLNVWYPAIGALGGALGNITLNGTFKKGGTILFVATWSLDAGDGIDDKFVVVSTEGEVAVFEGANPSGTTEQDWRLAGVYGLSRPLGKNAWLPIGGDLLILTEEGIVPVSVAVQKDPAALSLAAVSRSIEPVWKAAVTARKTLPWEIAKWSEKNMAIINAPVTGPDQLPISFVVNLETGAWARYTGWDTRTVLAFDDRAFFGANDGHVRQCEVGGNDDGAPYVSVYVGLFEQIGSPGQIKTIHQGRANFMASEPFIPLLSVSTDYNANLPPPPNSVPNYERDVWDVGLWDMALWDAISVPFLLLQWQSIGRTGFAIAPNIQVTSGIDVAPNAELISIDMTFETGDLVV